MPSFDPFSLSATSIVSNVASGAWQIEDIADFYVRRIDQYQAIYNTHLAWDRTQAESALQEQIKKIQSLRQNKQRLPLAGVPIAVKDNIMVEDQIVSCGSLMLKSHYAAYDATVVSRLREAGAIILGRTNMDEFGMGSTNEHSAYGPVRNPWSLAHVAGGSSGGSAAAVAADFAPLALGSDTGGSVRQPAAFCGVWGLKPSYGRISRYGLVAYASSLDQIGPLARSASDLALIYSVIAGHDPQDSSSRDCLDPVSTPTGVDLRGQKIAVLTEYMGEGLDSEVREAFTKALAVYRQAGAEIVELSLPEIAASIAAYYIIATAEASSNLARYDGVRFGHRTDKSGLSLKDMYAWSRTEGFGREVKQRIMLGTYILSAGHYDAYYAKANRFREILRRKFEGLFAQGITLVASPTSPTTAFRLGQKTNDSLEMYLSDIYTITANLTGMPALSHPIGFNSEGLPIGMQLMGATFSEENLLRSASVYEQHAKWSDRRRPSL